MKVKRLFWFITAVALILFAISIVSINANAGSVGTLGVYSKIIETPNATEPVEYTPPPGTNQHLMTFSYITNATAALTTYFNATMNCTVQAKWPHIAQWFNNTLTNRTFNSTVGPLPGNYTVFYENFPVEKFRITPVGVQSGYATGETQIRTKVYISVQSWFR